MAWEISMCQEGWDNVRRNVARMPTERMIAALTDDRYEEVEHKGGRHHAQRAADALRARLQRLADMVGDDVIADEVLDCIERNNLCDNGGWYVWIDREGCHRVPVDLQIDEEDDTDA